MKKFYMLVGNIGSGKSTYLKNTLASATVISKDGIRYAIGGGTYVFDYKLEPIIHSTTVFLTRSLCNADVSELVLDETNVKKKNRKQFIELAKAYDYEVIAVVMPPLSKEVCVNRRLTNPHSQPDRALWEGVWDKFHQQYTEPTLEEGFDKVIQVPVEEVM